MAGVTHDNPVPVNQYRVIVGWVDSEHRARREGARSVCHLAPFALAADLITFRVRPKAAGQTDKARKKEPENDRDTKENVPLHDKSLPKTEHHDEVGPEKELRIVPFPGSKFNQRTGNKGDGGRKE